MLFSSMTFVFVFMPLVMSIYLLSKKEIRNYVLLAASIIFYAWGEPRYLAIMIMTIFVTYAGARLIDRYVETAGRKWALALTILVDLGFLIYFKYFNFIVDNVNAALQLNLDFIDVVMPIGISFYTFQAISYLIDVYRREVEAQKDVNKLALYIVLFPQLVAGPIVKYHDVCEQIDERTVTFADVAVGLKRFIIGLAKKVLVANTLAVVVDRIFAQQPETLGFGYAWLGIVAYAVQLYFDFSGYSDMAIGLGRMFGFRFLENFNYPYISKSISEFWQRWHISLATWFKQYLYIPLGGNRVSPVRTYVNLFVVFLVTGIWHGASWTFVMWGVWNGVFICWEKYVGWHKDKPGETKLAGAAKHVYAMLAFLLGLVIFRSDDMAYAWGYLKQMFLIDLPATLPEADFGINNKFILMLVVGLVCSVPLFKNMIYVKYEHKVLRSIVNIWISLLFYWSTISLASSTYNPFIYFRF